MSSIGPQLPPHLLASTHVDDDSDEEIGPSAGPSLPPPPPGPQLPAGARPPAGPQRSAGLQILVGPQLPSSFAPLKQVDDNDDDADDYVPELPPGFAPKPTAASGRVQGPSAASAVGKYVNDDESDEDDGYGPMPLPAGVAHVGKDAVTEFREREEARRKALEEASKPKKLERDEWMLKPPTSSDLLSNIDPTKLTKTRRFAASSKPVGSRDTDSSLWTETPAERQQRLADEVAGKRRRAENAVPTEDEATLLERVKRRRQEDVVRRGVDEYTAKNRGGALVEQHSSASGSQTKDPEGGPTAIWDHSRDMALSGRLLDDRARERIIKDARGLGDRFGSGKSGGFL